MSKVDRWLLPDGIEEVLPVQAREMEGLRRQLVDLFERWGYDYVIPPMVEFTDSLLTGSGQDIDLLTFKITDQLSGRTLGIRADITPQAARMDAHSLKRSGVNRLCYAGHVLHTTPKSPLSSRSPLKVGVEMFGVAELNAEIEMISLLIETLVLAKLQKQYIDIGHVAIFRGLAEMAGLNSEQENTLFNLLQRKSFSEIDSWLEANVADETHRSYLQALPKLSGGKKVLIQARESLAGAPAAVLEALNDLELLSQHIEKHYPEAQLYFDLSELRGYHYHTGIVFGAFAPGVGNAIANGGRYDHVGEAFGRARSATGFDIDLSMLCRVNTPDEVSECGIFAISSDDDTQWKVVQDLRKDGERVVMAMPGQQEPLDYQLCDRGLVCEDGQWVVKPL